MIFLAQLLLLAFKLNSKFVCAIKIKKIINLLHLLLNFIFLKPSSNGMDEEESDDDTHGLSSIKVSDM